MTTEIDVSAFSCGICEIRDIRYLIRDESSFLKFIEEYFGTWDGYYSPDNASKSVFLYGQHGDHPTGMTCLFTDNQLPPGNGTWFAKMIKKHDLGEVTKVFTNRHNPHTGNKISLWDWKYNGKAPKKLRKKIAAHKRKNG